MALGVAELDGHGAVGGAEAGEGGVLGVRRSEWRGASHPGSSARQATSAKTSGAANYNTSHSPHRIEVAPASILGA